MQNDESLAFLLVGDGGDLDLIAVGGEGLVPCVPPSAVRGDAPVQKAAGLSIRGAGGQVAVAAGDARTGHEFEDSGSGEVIAELL